MKRDDIVKAIHDGSLAASKKYEEWSRGLTIFDSGVEGILVAGIAEALHRSPGNSGSLRLEVHFKDIQEWSEASRPPGRPRKELKGGYRMDIVLLNYHKRPICAIEVKRAWDPGRETTWENGNCLKDLKRLYRLVDSCSHQKRGSLRRGFLTVLLQESDKKEEIKDFVRDKFSRERDIVKIRFHEGEERSGMVPFSIEISSLNS